MQAGDIEPGGKVPQDSASKRVLVIDDDKLQLKLSRLRLHDAGFDVTAANSAEEGLKLAVENPPDVILSDVLMGEVDGFGLCRRLRAQAALADVPIVLASAHYSDPEAQSLAQRVGASALVGRTPDFSAELAALWRVLGGPRPGSASPDAEVYEQHLRTNAAQLSRLLGEAQDAHSRYRALFESATDSIAVLSRDGVMLEANERWRLVLGVEPKSLIGKHLLEYSAHGRDTSWPQLEAAIQGGGGRLYEVPLQRPDGATVYVDFSISVVAVGERSLVFAIGRDVTGRYLAARALAVAEEKYRSLVERLPDVVMTLSGKRFTFLTANVQQVTGFSQEEVYAMDMDAWLQRVHPADEDGFVHAFQEYSVPGSKRLFDVEYRWRRKDNQWIWLRHRMVAIYERNDVRFADGLLSDITDRKRLEESLRHAQKMEAIGQLTGGIAHDFNNILATILANSQFLLDSLGEQDNRLVDAQEIKLAAERAAVLTRQLLAFSRRQVLELRVTDLNSVITNVERMLRRLIGEDIELVVQLNPKLGNAHVDPAQIEQVLLNLSVNARDAMPQGGKLTIETSNVVIDASDGDNEASPKPGQYVAIAVSDTGTGMDEATQRRVFEPFFTTKAPGKGTGLGLATSHGIVTQSGGHIAVQSEPGKGSVFKVLLPRIDGPSQLPAPAQASPTEGGSELILLVEDDRPLRGAVQRMLTNRGYRVLVAKDAQEAVELAKQYGGQLALLLTDVIMPQVSGPAVAEAVREHASNVKVLFMSGYTDHAVLSNDIVDRKHHFIQKPFSPSALTAKVREALEN